MVTKEYIPNSQVRELDDTVSNYLDTREGVLLDSYIAYDKFGNLFVALDTYETAWTSGYTVYSGDNSKADNSALWVLWEDFTDRYDSGEY